jgi:hypothetical protein
VPSGAAAKVEDAVAGSHRKSAEIDRQHASSPLITPR